MEGENCSGIDILQLLFTLKSMQRSQDMEGLEMLNSNRARKSVERHSIDHWPMLSLLLLVVVGRCCWTLLLVVANIVDGDTVVIVDDI